LRPRGSAFGCGNAAYRAVFISVKAMDGVNARKFSFGPIADLRAAANSLPTAILDVSRFRASTSGGGGREAAVSSGGTALGTHLVGAGPIARLLWGRRYSATEMGSETAIRAAILPSRARAIRVTSE